MTVPSPLRAREGGAQLAVRVTPRAARSAVEGIANEGEGRAVLRIRLAAPPVDGAANEALIAFVANLFDVRRREVTIRSGHNARTKIIDLVGDPNRLADRLDRSLSRDEKASRPLPNQ